MIVMPTNNSSMHLGWLAGRHPGKVGWLLSPAGWRKPPRWMPYALDNGSFARWDEAAFLNMVRNVCALVVTGTIKNAPRWVVVPDVVADRDATLERWSQWSPELRAFGWPLAFAVQDGMTQADVPADADVIFVGGSTAWKWATVLSWCQNNPRVHVGRVNGYNDLRGCHDAGAESCDGTGWFRGDPVQLAGLERYLEESTTGEWAQERLCG